MKNFWLIILIAINLSCNSSRNLGDSKSEYFQGIVTYSIKYFPYSENILPSKLEAMLGNKMTMVFKEGNYVKRYYSPDSEIRKEIYLNLDKGKSFFKTIENDTIFWIDITKNDSKTTFVQIKDSIILNYPTICLKTKTTVGGYVEDAPKVSGELHFAKDLKVNPKWYQNYLEGNFNEQIKIGKGIQLLYISNGIYWKQIVSAIAVEPKKINDSEIELGLKGNEIMKEL